MAISVTDRPLIRRILRSNVEISAASLKPFLARGIWIGKTNRYLTRTVERLRLDGANMGGKRGQHLAQYIAASSVLHCNDAWSYMGRALNASMFGDPHRALHLAYYAELRATMSLLAASGIGVFNNKHYVVDAPLSARKLRTATRTHQFVWEMFGFWGKLPSSGHQFSQTIRPGGILLEDWLFPVGGSGAVSAQASSWFLQWGQDLKWGARDRESRNVSSYRPDGLPYCWIGDPRDTLDFVDAFWSAFEPAGGSLFDTLDNHILRLALENHYASSTGRLASGAGYLVYLDRILDNQHFGETASRRWKDFLNRGLEPEDNLLLRKASLKPLGTNPDHLAVAARAALVLRLATGAASDLLTKAGISVDDTSFWLEAVGTSRGLWNSGAAPDPLTDLWADVKDALDELSVFNSQYPPAERTAERLIRELGRSLSSLTSAERVSLWSLST